MFSRFTLYFDGVVRSGSMRRAADRLNISASAIDRQILLMEQQLGVPLFERSPQGLKLTAAGEVLIGYVRNWRRDYRNALAQIDELQGLRRGEVTIAVAEGLSQFAARALVKFRALYPGIDQVVRVLGGHSVVNSVLEGSAELGLTFNPPDVQPLRLETALGYPLGAIVPPDHSLAALTAVRFADCVEIGLVVPDESVSLRGVLDELWKRTIGGPLRGAVTASSTRLLKDFVLMGAGIGVLTRMDAASEIETGKLVFVPLADEHVPFSVASLITAAGRTLSPPSSLLVQLIARCLREEAPDEVN